MSNMAHEKTKNARLQGAGEHMSAPDIYMPESPMNAQASNQRMEKAFKRARRHSTRVRLLKFALPMTALVMVAAFAGKSWLASGIDGVSFDISSTAIENGRLVMADPRLDGFTNDNRAYSMTASRAIQDITGTGKVDLEQIDAKLPFDANNWMTVAARSGVLDRESNILDLNDDIKVVTDNGITALLRSAKVDMTAGSLNTQDPVDITLDGARIEADSLNVLDKGAVMIFENRVRMEIDGGRLQATTSPAGVTQ